jgi:uncharacterized membrane protein YcaP (DUF421 family)
MDWKAVFLPNVPLLEIFLRGTITYLAIFIMLRIVLKRESGTVGMTDILVIVLIADAAQNSMAGNYTSISDGLLLVATIIFWSYALEWLAEKSPLFERLLHKPPLLLVENGRMLRHNMRKELVTVEELKAELRKTGIEDMDLVKKAFMEGDGTFSIIRKDEQELHKIEEKRVV